MTDPGIFARYLETHHILQQNSYCDATPHSSESRINVLGFGIPSISSGYAFSTLVKRCNRHFGSAGGYLPFERNPTFYVNTKYWFDVGISEDPVQVQESGIHNSNSGSGTRSCLVYDRYALLKYLHALNVHRHSNTFDPPTLALDSLGWSWVTKDSWT